MGGTKRLFKRTYNERANQERKSTRALIALVELYRKHVSPLRPSSCRFYPSCSRYCQEAIKKHGVFKGLGYTLRRLLRCHPFSSGGYDPVE